MKAMMLVLVSCLVLVGCTADSLTGVEGDALLEQEPQVMAAKKSLEKMPYKGISYGYPVSQAPHPDCPGATVIKTESEGKGRANLLGKYTWSGWHCFDFEQLVFYEGHITIVTANGDEVYLEYNGHMTGETTWVARETILGGTGRFEGMNGWAREKGMIVEDGWVIRFKGRIAYNNSST